MFFIIAKRDDNLQMKVQDAAEDTQNNSNAHAENSTELRETINKLNKDENDIIFEIDDKLLEIGEDDSTTENKKTVESPAPDGGYGWFIVVAAFLSQTVLAGLGRCEGIYYLKFMDRYKSSASLSAWPGALLAATRLMLSPLASALCGRYSVRASVMLGTIFVVLGFILDGLAPNLPFQFFSHTLVQGLGRGLVYTPGLICVGMYFDKHRSKAAGLATAGVGVGSVVMVPLTQLLFDTYGFFGTFLVSGGIVCHGFLFGMLYRPLSTNQRFQQLDRLKKLKMGNSDKEKGASCQTSNKLYPYHYQENSSKKHTHCCSSALDILFPKDTAQPKRKKKRLFQYQLLRFPTFALYCFSMVLFNIANKAAFTFFPALVKSKGHSDTEAASVLSIAGVLDTLGRVFAGFVLDLPWVRPHRPILYNGILVFVSFISFTMPHLEGYVPLAIVCALYGALTGAYVSQKSVVLVDFLNKEYMADAFGLLNFFQGIGTAIGPPLSGALKDIFGDYKESFYLGGGCMVVACLLMVTGNVCLWIKNKRGKSESSDN